MAGTVGNDGGPKNALGHQSPGHCPPSAGAQGSARRGIVIQLTGTEGEWDSLDDNELIFQLERDQDGPSAPLQKQRSCPYEDDWGLHSPAFHVPLSPSSPGSLGDVSASMPGFLSPGQASPKHRPLANLVKSLSTELELKESTFSSSSLKPRPLLSLVKSISTELSRSEPEVSQSKSDSRLNLHLLKQLAQSKDSRTAPPSPVNLSPTEAKPGFFKVELEDTKRKLQEAMHEPMFSMFSKIMGDDSGGGSGSPKHQRPAGSVDSPSHKGFYAVLGRSTGDFTVTESQPRSTKSDGDFNLPTCNWPVRRARRKRSCAYHGHHGRQKDTSLALELHHHGDKVTQVIGGAGHNTGIPRPPAVPGTGLCFLAALFYSYFIMPLTTYMSGLCVGLIFGFMLGLLLVRLGLSRQTISPNRRNANQDRYSHPSDLQGDPPCLKGWLNEMHTYDPDYYHPSLTHSVYASLEGSSLRLDYPRQNIRRRATFDEQLQEQPTFVRSRKLQLTGSKVFLFPVALARKRVWNQKYPICITLAKGEQPVLMELRDDAQGWGTDGGMGGGGGGGGGEQYQQDRPASAPANPRTATPATTLYLFGRTGREKEEWFHHLLAASRTESLDRLNRCGSRSDISVPHAESPSTPVASSRVSSGGSTEDLASVLLCPRDLAGRVRGSGLLHDYASYMGALMRSQEPSPTSSPGPSSTQASPTEKEVCCCHMDAPPPDWINALIGRIFWDFLQEKYWADMVSHKIQKKLSKIRLPYFMNELTLTELDMGCGMPQIINTYDPRINRRGLWLELDMEYTGALQMTLETKINLAKLGKDSLEPDRVVETARAGKSRMCVLADSEEESSSAGSTDEEEGPLPEPQWPLGEKGSPGSTEGPTASGRTGRRILRFVDKIAKSKYFQKATENEYIKKKIEEVSNTPLLLTVEVRELAGTLAVNIPPPPTDRIWYDLFCDPPRLDLRVRPKLGEREVTFCHVTEWIQKKLQDEFQKVFVLPNMDDIYLPLMHSGMDQLSGAQNPPAAGSPLHSPSAESIEASVEWE
ncbi:hypothetical protein ACEWY4_025832 [Coilia grayii]|uniref:SMP-LTD domain-containing protein n=1 Tax=Coilia grayii TaxID=363190 RepID=A0ABD1ITL1_9TELE